MGMRGRGYKITTAFCQGKGIGDLGAMGMGQTRINKKSNFGVGAYVIISENVAGRREIARAGWCPHDCSIFCPKNVDHWRDYQELCRKHEERMRNLEYCQL
eukprot:1393533-Amorphochlora_amoeboformis.AAC.1